MTDAHKPLPEKYCFTIQPFGLLAYRQDVILEREKAIAQRLRKIKQYAENIFNNVECDSHLTWLGNIDHDLELLIEELEGGKEMKLLTCKHCGHKEQMARGWDYQKCTNCQTYYYDTRFSL